MDVPRSVGAARTVLHIGGSYGHSADLRGSRLHRHELASRLRPEPGERKRRLVGRPAFDGQLLTVSAALGPGSVGHPARSLPRHLPDDGALETAAHLVG